MKASPTTSGTSRIPTRTYTTLWRVWLGRAKKMTRSPSSSGTPHTVTIGSAGTIGAGSGGGSRSGSDASIARCSSIDPTGPRLDPWRAGSRDHRCYSETRMELPSDDSLRWIVGTYARVRSACGEALGAPALVQPTGEFFPDEF